MVVLLVVAATLRAQLLFERGPDWRRGHGVVLAAAAAVLLLLLLALVSLLVLLLGEVKRVLWLGG